jgi:hypothetical protein
VTRPFPVRRELESSASPAICDFQSRLDSELARLRRDSINVEPTGQFIPRTGEPVVRTNVIARRSRIAGIHEAREAAAALRFQIMSDEEIAARCADLWDALPDDNKME